MRLFLALAAAAAVTACGNTYHPEYHPVTTTTYSQHVSTPAYVQTVQGQPVYATAPAPGPTVVFPPPQQPPEPPESFPW
jgi:hypothetical protein